VGKPEGEIALERIGVSRWEDNTKMDLEWLSWEGVGCIDAS